MYQLLISRRTKTKYFKMKSMIVVALALVAVAAAFPVEDSEAKIISQEYEQNPDGGYKSEFQTDNGIQKEETGSVKEVLDEDNKPHLVVIVRGTYSYPGADGKPQIITYEADENGFRPEGASIPVAPVSARR